MNSDTGNLTKEMIWTLASEIRCERSMNGDTDGYTIAGDCEAISNHIVSALPVPAKNVFFEVGSEREPHHAVVIQMRDVADGEFEQSYSDDALLLIDASIEQFSHENKEQGLVNTALANAAELPRIGIYPPESNERLHWYFTPDTPGDDTDTTDTTDVLESLDPNELLEHSNPTIV